MPFTDTVSMCASKMIRRDGSCPGKRATTLRRPGKHLAFDGFDAIVGEKFAHVIRDCRFARAGPLRVDAFDADQVGECFVHSEFVVEMAQGSSSDSRVIRIMSSNEVWRSSELSDSPVRI